MIRVAGSSVMVRAPRTVLIVWTTSSTARLRVDLDRVEILHVDLPLAGLGIDHPTLLVAVSMTLADLPRLFIV